MDTTNDPNPKGTEWYNQQIYGKSLTMYPEEDYQVAALPKAVLYQELGKRLDLADLPVHVVDVPVRWSGKIIDFSAVSDSQLMHHIGIKLAECN